MAAPSLGAQFHAGDERQRLVTGARFHQQRICVSTGRWTAADVGANAGLFRRHVEATALYTPLRSMTPSRADQVRERGQVPGTAEASRKLKLLRAEPL